MYEDYKKSLLESARIFFIFVSNSLSKMFFIYDFVIKNYYYFSSSKILGAIICQVRKVALVPLGISFSFCLYCPILS